MSDLKPKSASKQFNTDDAAALGKNAMLVGAAAALTFIGSNLADVDFGVYTAAIVPMAMIAIDFAIKFLKDNTKTK